MKKIVNKFKKQENRRTKTKYKIQKNSKPNTSYWNWQKWINKKRNEHKPKKYSNTNKH